MKLNPVDQKIAQIQVDLLKKQEMAAREEMLKRYGHNSAEGWSKQFITRYEPLIETRDQAVEYSANNYPVLIYGESGTGKELLAHILHGDRSVQAEDTMGKLFVSFNASGIVDTLFESILFGYTKGSHSTAFKDTMGLFVSANGGTLFFDEIGELPLTQQAKLLRVLETRRITPVGSTEEQEITARLVFATNRPLQKMVREGKFREDLYWRISTLKLFTVPTRDRSCDKQPLVSFWTERMNLKLPTKLGEMPDYIYSSTGNVRAIKSALIYASINGHWPTDETKSDW
jgi:transcriptional regulator with PAS, ATPase and Fis domain